MDPGTVYATVGALLVALGLAALARRTHLIRRIVALNVVGSGTFLVLVGLAQRDGGSDPVAQALVLTGIVVAVSATALALVLFRRLHATTGATDVGDATDAGDGT